MVNRRAKGRRNELKAKKILEEEGYIVETVKGATKFNKQVDFFGLFDLIALKLFEKNRCEIVPEDRRWIQVKTNRKPSKKLIQELTEFKGKYLVFDSVEVWIFHDYKREPEIICIE